MYWNTSLLSKGFNSFSQADDGTWARDDFPVYISRLTYSILRKRHWNVIVGAATLPLVQLPRNPVLDTHLRFDWQLVKPIIRQLNTPDPSWWNDLPKITAPTLIIGGGPTSHVPQEKLTKVAQLISECKLVAIDGAGHVVHKNRPEEYKALLRDFLFR